MSPELVDLSNDAALGGGTLIAHPDLPGTDISFAGTTNPSIPPSAADTIAIPLVHDWGPIGSDPAGSNGLAGGPQLITSYPAWTGLFGDSDTAGRTAVAGGFAGQNLPGKAGAGAIWVWRMAGSSVAAATVTITGVTGGTPATLSLAGYYKGSRGDRISYSVDPNPSDTSQDRLRIYFDGGLQESYIYDPTGGDTINILAARIAAKSTLVIPTAIVGTSTNHLTPTPSGAPVSLSGGNDGSTVLSADHLGALAGLAHKQFGVIAPFDLTDPSIQASYLSWVQAQAQANMPVRCVLGGAAGEDIDDAIGGAGDLDDEHVIRVGGGTYHDDLLDKDLSTSQLAPRIAGILAAKGETSSITFSKMGGLHVVVGPADDEILLGVQGGVVLLAPTSSADADLRIEKGVTSFTDSNNPAKPLDVYGDPRLIGIMDDYVRNMTEWGNDTIIGDLPVNDDTRRLVRGYARSLQDDLLTAGLILPADPNANPPIVAPWVVCVDPEQQQLEDTIPYTFGWRFAKTANNIIGQGAIS